jgi:hypothetical protein
MDNIRQDVQLIATHYIAHPRHALPCRDFGLEGAVILEKSIRLVLVAGVVSGCAVQRAVVARGAQEKMVGLSREQVLACMGPPASKATEGSTEVWSYSSGNDHVTAIGTGYAQTDGTFTSERRGGTFSGTGSSTTTSLNTVNATRRSCTVNVVLNEGMVSRLNYSGPTGGILTAGEQCAFAVENCAR